MNYRHAYHAGNFADVVKHAVLVRLVEYLKGKDKAFRIIDTHAGIGLYDFSSPEAQKTGEWRDGIGRLLETSLAPPAADLMAPYLVIVRDVSGGDGLRRYPGSPLLARRLLRVACPGCRLKPAAEEIGRVYRIRLAARGHQSIGHNSAAVDKAGGLPVNKKIFQPVVCVERKNFRAGSKHARERTLRAAV